MTNAIAKDQLLSIIERVEHVQAEIDALNDDKSEIFKEAKANGFHTKTIKTIIKRRGMDPIEREEMDALYDLYCSALGMTPESLAHARVENIEEFPRDGGKAPVGATEGEAHEDDRVAGRAGIAIQSGPDGAAKVVCNDDAGATSSQPGEEPGTSNSDRPSEAPMSSGAGEGLNPQAGRGTDEEPVTVPSTAVEGVSSLDLPEAQMPRASSPAVKTGKGGKLPVPGADQGRFARTQDNTSKAEIDLTIPPFLRRGGTKAETASESNVQKDTVSAS